jgi:uncharacterized membrane protein
MKIDSAVMAVLAIIAGILILFKWIDLYLVIGVYLIVIGILGLMRRS